LLEKAKSDKVFIKSNFKARKKEKKNTKLTLMTPTLDCSNMEALTETYMKKVKNLTKILILLRKKILWLKL